MTEGSPVISNHNTALQSAPGLGEAAAQELVLIYAPGVPPQLEHWLRKRGMRLHVSESMSLDPNEIRNLGARYVYIDLDALPADRNPIEVVRTLRAQVPEVKLGVMTHRSDDTLIRGLTEVGAVSVVIKQPYVADLVFSLQAVQEGRSYVSGVATERERAAVQITAREREVLELMANGHSNQSIGEKLSISVKTVEAHRARLFKKLGASNVADAVLLAIRTGLVMP
jgi:DNA-binding NarL/FixJ family response regulator